MDAIKKAEEFVKDFLDEDVTGHDWHHSDRIRKTAKLIAEKEGANLLIVELTALLHDVADYKFHDHDPEKGIDIVREFLESIRVDHEIVKKICYIILNISFKGVGADDNIETIEGKCVQDADRLDGIGAIGIARTFAYGAHVGRPIYDPETAPKHHKNFEDYKKNGDSASINHFYEKLLHLKDKMKTETGKKLAQSRHDFIVQFLEEFLREWDGKDF